jgi:nucleoside-diphosphate kinase
MVLAGQGVINISRKMMGKTFGFEAEPGTIRGDFGASKTYNLIHGSDAPETAETEIALYFKPDELLSYETATAAWTFKAGES